MNSDENFHLSYEVIDICEIMFHDRFTFKTHLLNNGDVIINVHDSYLADVKNNCVRLKANGKYASSDIIGKISKIVRRYAKQYLYIL